MSETNGHTQTRLGKAQRRLEALRLKQQLAEARIRLARAERQAKAEELKTAHWWPQDQNPARHQLHENIRRKRDHQAELVEAKAAGKDIASLQRSEVRGQRSERLSEQNYLWDWVGGYQDMLDRLRSPDGLLLSAISIVADRRYGAYWPFFRTWQELALLRGAARIIYQTSALARGATQGLVSYIIGDGFTYRAVPKPGCPPGLRVAVQEVLDENSDVNDWPSLEAECLRRDVRDGEWFLRDFAQQDGSTQTRVFGPEMLIQPADSTLEEWSFGKQNPTGPEHDVQTTLAYNVCYEGDNTRGEVVPASEVIEHKSNVDRDVKRGIPDLAYDTYDFLKTAGRLILNMGEGCAIQAAVAEIRQWEGPVTGDQASDFVAANTDYTVPNPWTGTEENVRQVRPGEVRDIPKGMSYVPPPFTQGSPVFIAVEQAVLRAVAVTWNAPEWLTSGDASNSNYACHDSATELLTRRGWLRYDQLQYGDQAGTMNPETGEFEWQEIQAIHIHDYDGEMVRLSGSHNLDVLVTPNHRMYVSQHQHRRHGGRKGKLVREGIKPFSFIRADELRPGSILPFACKPKEGIAAECFEIPGIRHNRFYLDESSHPQARNVPMASFLGFLGWWIAEGWTVKRPPERTNHGHTVALSQRADQSLECGAIRGCLAGLKPAFNVNELLAKDGMIKWQINDKSLWTWLRHHCGIGSYTKKLPDFVHDLPAGQQEVLLESLLLGDGTHFPNGSAQYFSVSKSLADGVQALALQTGHISHVNNPMANGVLPISVKRADRHMKVSARHISRVPHRGVVWCVTVPNGLTITRRNGKSIITGNSSLTAESPFVKTGQHKQSVVYRPRFLLARWRVLRNYCRAKGGIVANGQKYDWPQVQRFIDLQCEPPSMEVRNRLDEAQANATRIEGGWKSRQTVSAEENLDWEQEVRNMKQYQQEFPDQPLPEPGKKETPKVPKPPHPSSGG